MSVYNIDFSPRILYEALGYKNIEIDSIAFAEQIKNSYDAKAKNVILDFSDYNNDTISILDNGLGMNEEELKENWLLVGTKGKVPNADALGGKGIGRFSLFRLADTITIISKKKNFPEYELSLSKDALENLDSMRDFKVEIIKNEKPKIFSNKDSGTKIILTNLKQINFYEIFEDLYNLIQPDCLDEIPIKVDYIYPDFFEEPSVISVNKAMQYAPFFCKATFKENYLIHYDYKCIINNSVLYQNKNPQTLTKFFSELPNFNLGTIDFYLCNYYFHHKFISLLDIPKDNLQDNFLNIYQGISIYRENFKIYGHGKTDWLKLAEQRVNKPTQKIDNRLSFGYVVLERPHSDSLEEKTSREGFLKGDAYNYLISSINLIIDEFNNDRTESIKIISKDNFSKIIKLAQNNKDVKEDKNKYDNNILNTENNEEKINNNAGATSNISSKTPDSKKENPSNPNTGGNIVKEKRKINTKPPKPTYSNKIIIDTGFECPESAPEKIKRIIYELQVIEHKDSKPALYSQALLIRCLIDISTQYAKKQLILEKNKGKPYLLGDIKSVLNKIYIDKLLPSKDKHIQELQTFLKEDSTIDYFNGIAHDYDYRTHFEDIKKIWDKFEFYIEFCINQ